MPDHFERDKAYDPAYDNQCLKSPGLPYKEPKFLQVDRKIKETEQQIEFIKKNLVSAQAYLKQLNEVRKKVTPEDEARIQALVSVGLI